jgi:hypothetical protein
VWKLFRTAGDILLSIPFFLVWPIHIWNWAARASHIPADERQGYFSWCLAGFGIILMGAFAMLLAPHWMVFLKFVAPYIGAGLPTVQSGICLSRKYRHLLKIRPITYTTKLLEYKPEQ